MCGIVAYLGHREACPIILKGLHRLEYRGYDSAGVALLNGTLSVYKKKGKVAELENFLVDKDTHATVGMGHTRWATHGEPNDVNAHPHYSTSERIAIIHNGIIENYAALKTHLEQQGHVFHSDTDTEVFVNLIEEIQTQNECTLEEAVRLALHEVIGAYAIVVLSKDAPDQLIAARKGSPLVIGIGEGEFFVASDATPIIEYTNEVVYVNDYELAVIKDGQLAIRSREDVVQTPYIQRLELELDSIEKGGYE
ncbi:MAG: glutamine--fructose-6-phosphate aminotransferase, partial [Hymenobacter sp.]